MCIQNIIWHHEAEPSLCAKSVHGKACLSHPCTAHYLERIQIIPGQSPGHHLPQDNPKWVHISRLAVVMLRDHLHCSHDSQHMLTANAWVWLTPVLVQEPYKSASFVSKPCGLEPCWARFIVVWVIDIHLFTNLLTAVFSCIESPLTRGMIYKQTAPYWACQLWGQPKLSTLSHEKTLQGMLLIVESLSTFDYFYSYCY